jgi:hypothetical protein
MGWCHAFGPQIRDGCDHAMVADYDSCSCSACGAVCHGLFPGCSSVWAAGPRGVSITRPTREPGNLLPALTPIAPATATRSDASTASDGPAVPAVTAVTDQSELHALRVDMQVLMWKFDQLQQATPPSDVMVSVAAEVRAVAHALPQQVRDAVSGALEVHRHETRRMFTEIEQKIVADIDELRDKLQAGLAATAGGAGLGEPEVSLADLDARFQWLVDAVSARFVALGNGLARIERRLDDEYEMVAPANGSTAARENPARENPARENPARENPAREIPAREAMNGGGRNGNASGHDRGVTGDERSRRAILASTDDEARP